MSLTIGVDVGGTKVAGGVVDEAGMILARARVDIPPLNSAAAEEAIITVVGELRREHEVESVGVGVAGFVDAERAGLHFSANLPGWDDEPLRDHVMARVGLPVVIENDANAAAWGEHRFGAGRGETHLVCVTVGTGVGGGIIIDSELFRGRYGIGAEIGHMRVVADGRRCGCGQRGCWEQYASGNALVREARERATEARSEAGVLLRLGDGTPEGIRGPHVTEAARHGDAVALAAFEAIGTWLGQGLADLAAVLDPGCFVIGGGVSEAGDL
ncbi:MAG TPA: ROK family glucokinase, partial [Actinomycetes bacterium]